MPMGGQTQGLGRQGSAGGGETAIISTGGCSSRGLVCIVAQGLIKLIWRENRETRERREREREERRERERERGERRGKRKRDFLKWDFLNRAATDQLNH